MLKLSNETKIGILAIVSIAAAIWGYNFLKGRDILTTSQIFYVKYKNVDQLQLSSPVRINGFQVGIVKELSIDPADDQTIVATLNVNRGVDVPKNTLATIVNQSVMGGKAIDLLFAAPCEGGDCAESGSFLLGKSKSLVESLLGSPEEIDPYTERLQRGLTAVYDSIADPKDPKGLGRSLVALERSLINLEGTTSRLNRFLDASTNGISTTAKNAAEISNTLRQSDEHIAKALADLSVITAQLRNANLDKVSGKSAQALDSITVAVAALRRTMSSAERASDEINVLAKNFNSPDGFTGKLMKDKELYDNIVRTTRHVQLLSQDLRLHPKRYTTVKLKVFGKNKTKEYEIPYDDPAYRVLIDSLERDYSRRIQMEQQKKN